MAQAHDDRPVSVLRCAGRNHKLCGKRLLGDDQRVIAGAGERRVEPCKYALSIVLDPTRLAMHQLAGADDLASECLADGLMAQADTQNRNFAGHVPYQRNENASLARRTGPRREQDAVGLQRLDLLDCELIVAMDLDLGPQFSEILDEVVGERIVVVEDKNHIEV